MKTNWLCLAIAVASLVSVPQPAQSAVPPLSERNLQVLSSHIVNGVVTAIQSKKVPNQYGYNFEHTATIKVAKVDRSASNSIKPGQTIEVVYITIGSNGGRSGSQRQQHRLQPGFKAKLFILPGQDGRLYLLEPNGWRFIQEQN
jgi:hypothetical protein